MEICEEGGLGVSESDSDHDQDHEEEENKFSVPSAASNAILGDVAIDDLESEKMIS